jgi:hypothetical protein
MPRIVVSHGIGGLCFVFAGGAVFAAHDAGADQSAAVDTFAGAVPVNVFAGRRLQTSVSIGRGTAVNTVFFAGIVLMQPINTLGTARAEFCRSAMNAFRHTYSPVSGMGGSTAGPYLVIGKNSSLVYRLPIA